MSLGLTNSFPLREVEGIVPFDTVKRNATSGQIGELTQERLPTQQPTQGVQNFSVTKIDFKQMELDFLKVHGESLATLELEKVEEILSEEKPVGHDQSELQEDEQSGGEGINRQVVNSFEYFDGDLLMEVKFENGVYIPVRNDCQRIFLAVAVTVVGFVTSFFYQK